MSSETGAGSTPSGLAADTARTRLNALDSHAEWSAGPSPPHDRVSPRSCTPPLRDSRPVLGRSHLPSRRALSSRQQGEPSMIRRRATVVGNQHWPRRRVGDASDFDKTVEKLSHRLHSACRSASANGCLQAARQHLCARCSTGARVVRRQEQNGSSGANGLTKASRQRVHWTADGPGDLPERCHVR